MSPAEARLAFSATDAQASVVVAQTRLDQALAQRRDIVRDLRAEGWSLQRIADHIGVTKTAIANICR